MHGHLRHRCTLLISLDGRTLPQSGWQIKHGGAWLKTTAWIDPLRLSYGCVEDGVWGFLAVGSSAKKVRSRGADKRNDGGKQKKKQVEEERCAVFLTMDRVGSSILATIQPLYKYRRESPLVPVALWGARLCVGFSSSLPAYYSTRFVISPSPSSSSSRCFLRTPLSLSLAREFPFFFFSFFFRMSARAFCHR